MDAVNNVLEAKTENHTSMENDFFVSIIITFTEVDNLLEIKKLALFSQFTAGRCSEKRSEIRSPDFLGNIWNDQASSNISHH